MIIIDSTTIYSFARAQNDCTTVVENDRFQRNLSGSCASYDFAVDCQAIGAHALLRERLGDTTNLERSNSIVSLVRGETPAEFAQVYSDFVANFESRWWVCQRHRRDGDMRMRLGEGFDGLGYLHATQFTPQLRALVNTENFSGPLGGDLKSRLLRTIWWLGDREASDAMAAQFHQGQSVVEFRYQTLQYLQAWNSDAATQACMDAFSSIAHQDTQRECAIYLGRRGHQVATSLIRRKLDDLQEDGIRSLGLLDARSALADVQRKYERGGNPRVAAAIALVNIQGQRAWRSLTRLIDENWSTRSLILEMAYLRDARFIRRTAIPYLRRLSRNWQQERRDDALRATVVRAQLGDTQAIPELISILEGSDQSARDYVVKAVGANFGSRTTGIGTRIVADQRLIAPLLETAMLESNRNRRLQAVQAALHIRAHLQARE